MKLINNIDEGERWTDKNTVSILKTILTVTDGCHLSYCEEETVHTASTVA